MLAVYKTLLRAWESCRKVNSLPLRLSLLVLWKLSHVTHCLQCSLVTKEPGFPAFWYIAEWPFPALLPRSWLYLELSQGLTGACSCPTRAALLSCRQSVIPQREGEWSFNCYTWNTLHMILSTLSTQLQPWPLLVQIFWCSGLTWASISECVITALVRVSKKTISRKDLRDLVFLKARFLEHCVVHLSLRQTRSKGSLLNRIMACCI